MGQRKPKIQLPPQSKDEKDRLLSEIPNDAQRIKVTDSTGREKWREIDGVLDADTIHTKQGGKAVTMAKRPGRKGPTSDKAKQVQANREAIERDPLFMITRQSPDSPQVLNEVMVSLAREAASMEQERARREYDGLATTQVSGKRVTTLKAIGDTWLKWREQTSSNEIDMDSEKFKTLFAYILETFTKALSESNLRPEQVETVMARLHNLMEGDWSVDARRRMKKVG